MKKLIKHEFLAVGRLMLPLLLICAVSGIMMALLKDKDLPSVFLVLTTMIFVLSVVGSGIVALVIIVSRFYNNTMADSAYLTMTLPLNIHEFLWAELLAFFIWALITAVVLAVIFVSIGCIVIPNLAESFRALPELYRALLEKVSEYGMTGSLTAFCIEAIIFAVLGFFMWCLHVFLSMAIGQSFSKHKVLLSVVAYVAINIVGTALLSPLTEIYSRLFSDLSSAADSFASVLQFGIYGNAVLLIGAAVMYALTALLLTKKLNLP